jgi:hypothetical protein
MLIIEKSFMNIVDSSVIKPSFACKRFNWVLTFQFIMIEVVERVNKITHTFIDNYLQAFIIIITATTMIQ